MLGMWKEGRSERGDLSAWEVVAERWEQIMLVVNHRLTNC